MLQPRIAIVILNWNGWKDTIECLESLYQIAYQNYDIFLVDNASTDDSVLRITEYYKNNIQIRSEFVTSSTQNKPIPLIQFNREDINDTKGFHGLSEALSHKQLFLIRNEQNYGFAEGNNIGIRCALKHGSDAVVLLNNDTIVDPGFLTEMVKASEYHQSAGFFGPKIYYYDSKGRKDVISSAGGKFRKLTGMGRAIGKNEVDIGQYDAISEVDYLEGSCLLVKRQVIHKIGLLDPVFFAYWEDVDWCVRGKHQGYASIYVPNAKVWHKTSASNVERANIYFMARNRFWFMKKNSSPMGYRVFLLYFFLWPFWRISASLAFYRRSLLSLRRFWLGVFHGLRPEEARIPS